MRKWFIAVASMSVLLISCVRDICFDTDGKSMLVVECVLSNEDVQELKLYIARGFGNSTKLAVDDATIILTDVTESSIVGYFQKSNADVWTLDYMPSLGHRYRVDISVQGFDPIFAEDTMPGFNVRTIDVGENERQFDEWDQLIEDHYYPDNAKNQYIPYYHDYYLYPGTYINASSLPDYCIVYFANKVSSRMIESEICTDYHGIRNINVLQKVYESSKICFGREVAIYDPKNDDAVFELTTYPTLQGQTLHSNYLVFCKDDLVQKRWFTISGNYKDLVSSIVIQGVSECYYLYLIDARSSIMANESTDLASVFVRKNSYSNVHGGLGIFAASWSQKVSWYPYLSVRNISSEVDVYEDEWGKHWQYRK